MQSQFKHKHEPHLCIEDPFDSEDNVARSLTEASVKRVRLEFLRAFEIMSASGDYARLCSPSVACEVVRVPVVQGLGFRVEKLCAYLSFRV